VSKKPPRNEQSGTKVGSIASKALQNPRAVTLREIQALAGSVMTQRPNKPKR
jgi:hypothetical protein